MTIFREIPWPLGCFQRFRVLKQTFVSRKLNYHNCDIMKYSSFLNLVFRKKDMLLRKFDCVLVLAIRGLLHMTKNFVLWCDFVFLITVTESFLKSFLKEIMALSKTCVRFRNRIFKRFEWVLIKLFFIRDCWVKDLFAIMEKVWKRFHFGNWPFLCLRKLNFWVWEGDFWVEPIERS